jgi:hypothetical protein
METTWNEETGQDSTTHYPFGQPSKATLLPY